MVGSSILGGSWWAIGAAAILGGLFYLKSSHEERFLRLT